MKGCILSFPTKGDLRLAKNYRGITLISIAAKIYNALQRNRIEPKIDNILRKNQNGFRRNRSTTSQILTICRILDGVRAKVLQVTLLFVNCTKAFDSIHRGKMEQILLAYGLPKETVAAIMILYGNTKVKVRSPDGDTENFDIVAGVLQGDTLAPYLFIICLDYVVRTSIDKTRENGFELTKKRSRRYPAKTITDADYADDIALLANTPNQAETLLHSLERATAGIDLHVNAHKTEYMCYNQTDDISTLDGTTLKLVDKFTYQGSSVLSTEDIDTLLMKAWTAIDKLFKKRGRKRTLASIEDSVDTSIQRPEDYIQKQEGGLITATRIDTENTMNNRMTITRKQKWEGKQLYGRFKRLINNISHQKTWTWLKKGNFKRETESLETEAQDNAVRTNHIKARIDKTQQNSKCRLCGDETINHIINECNKLVQRVYKARHDWVGQVIHREMCKKCKFDHTNK